MAQLDRVARRLDLKIVYWGPGRGGKTTSLRSLHGGFAATERGEVQSVETADERTYFFDYAPLDLPRYRDHALRVHAYTVPGQDVYVETRKRILRGVDGVVFVADASPAAQKDTLASYVQLEECLRALEGARRPHPVLVAVNKVDLPGAIRADAMRERLLAGAPGRVPLEVVETTAVAGLGVVRCFRSLLLAAADHALAGSSSSRDAAEREEFLGRLATRLRGGDDGADLRAKPAGAGARRTIVADAAGPSDAAGLEVALDATRRAGERDEDVRVLHRQQAHGKLLLDLGRMCLEANEAEPFASAVLSTLVWNLEAASGWIGIPSADGGTTVLDGRGRAGEIAARVIGRLATQRVLALETGETARVEVPLGTGIPGGPDGKTAMMTTFATGDGRRGWILLTLGDAGRGIGDETSDVLVPAGAYVGITLARLAALDGLREANGILERRVAERTADLRLERDSLERRVAERTLELEAAKHATVQAERRLLDLERTEGIKRLAAGLAHEVNNPIGAACGNLEFARETIEGLLSGLGDAARADATEALDAVSDARAELRKVAANVTSLFDGAAASRRAALRTPVAAFVREAVRAHVKANGDAPEPLVREADAVACGIPPAEGSRWVFRLLGALGRDRRSRLELAIDRCDDGPRIVVEIDEPAATRSSPDLDALALEIERAGGALRTFSTASSSTVRIVLPRAIGEGKGATTEAVR